MLRTYLQCLGTYHLHPEAKFQNGEHTDVGVTERRHVHAKGVEHIGKEANRWEERFFVGDDAAAQVSYGQPDEHRERERLRDPRGNPAARRAAGGAGERAVAGARIGHHEWGTTAIRTFNAATAHATSQQRVT